MTGQFQEKDYAANLLYLEKIEATTLCTAALESANDQVRTHTTGLLTKSLTNQKNLFEIMKQKGWYKVEAATQDQFTRTQQSVSTIQSQL